MDEASNLQPCYLDSLAVDLYSLDYLELAVAFYMPTAEYFSRLKNLEMQDLIYDDATFHYGWDIARAVAQSLTTLDIRRDDEDERKFLRWPCILVYGILMTKPCYIVFQEMLEATPHDLGRFPALQHFKIHLPITFENNEVMLRLLNKILSISSSTSAIETLEIKISWMNLQDMRDGEKLFSSDAGWSKLDEALSSGKFVSLTRVVWNLNCYMKETEWIDYDPKLELEFGRSLARFVPGCIDALFPMFRALALKTRCYLEINCHYEQANGSEYTYIVPLGNEGMDPIN